MVVINYSSKRYHETGDLEGLNAKAGDA
jgi:hypothetical protein